MPKALKIFPRSVKHGIRIEPLRCNGVIYLSEKKPQLQILKRSFQKPKSRSRHQKYIIFDPIKTNAIKIKHESQRPIKIWTFIHSHKRQTSWTRFPTNQSKENHTRDKMTARNEEAPLIRRSRVRVAKLAMSTKITTAEAMHAAIRLGDFPSKISPVTNT